MKSMNENGNGARQGLSSKYAAVAFGALLLSLLPDLPRAYAQTEGGKTGYAGWYLSVPVYLYGPYSASGIQLGCQKGALHLRLDGSFVAETEGCDQVVFANPSLGAFFSHEWEGRIRIYEGLTLGLEIGLLNSFEGLVYTLSYQMGAEWLVFERKAFYVEFGAGVGFLPKEGAFNGGTIVGGGIKCFL